MFGTEHLLADRQRALVKRARRRKVTLVPEQAGEAVEARRRIGMFGAEHLLADRQCIANKLHGLRVTRALTEITACPSQKLGPACKDRSVIGIRIAKRQQMRCEAGAQWP